MPRRKRDSDMLTGEWHDNDMTIAQITKKLRKK